MAWNVSDGAQLNYARSLGDAQNAERAFRRQTESEGSFGHFVVAVRVYVPSRLCNSEWHNSETKNKFEKKINIVYDISSVHIFIASKMLHYLNLSVSICMNAFDFFAMFQLCWFLIFLMCFWICLLSLIVQIQSIIQAAMWSYWEYCAARSNKLQHRQSSRIMCCQKQQSAASAFITSSCTLLRVM